jgi:hypothetical protein
MAKNLDDTTTPLNGSAGGDCFEDAQRPQKPTPHGGNLDAGSAPPSNTAPSNCMDSLSGTTMLRVGIDSLYVSCKGQISEKTENLLRLSKELAQSADPDVRAGAFLEFGDHRFQVMDKGKRLFPYVLADNWFHLCRVATLPACRWFIARYEVKFWLVKDQRLFLCGWEVCCWNSAMMLPC